MWHFIFQMHFRVNILLNFIKGLCLELQHGTEESSQDLMILNYA